MNSAQQIFKITGFGRLDKRLTEIPELAGLTRSFIQRLIRSNRILVNDCMVSKCGHELEGESEITILPAPSREKYQDRFQDLRSMILFEDEVLMVVNKPAGLLVHGITKCRDDLSLVSLLQHYLPEFTGEFSNPDRLGLVHRLDKDTSGVMVIAKNQKALANLSSQFMERRVQKTYGAIVHTTPRRLFSSGIVVAAQRRAVIRQQVVNAAIVSSDNQTRALQVQSQFANEYSDCRVTVTGFEVVSSFADRLYLEVRLFTGRNHQIRCTLSYLGYPIFGDSLYGYPSSLISRQALHALSLTLKHPLSGDTLTFSADLPNDMTQLLVP